MRSWSLFSESGMPRMQLIAGLSLIGGYRRQRCPTVNAVRALPTFFLVSEADLISSVKVSHSTRKQEQLFILQTGSLLASPWQTLDGLATFIKSHQASPPLASTLSLSSKQVTGSSGGYQSWQCISLPSSSQKDWRTATISRFSALQTAQDGIVYSPPKIMMVCRKAQLWHVDVISWFNGSRFTWFRVICSCLTLILNVFCAKSRPAKRQRKVHSVSSSEEEPLSMELCCAIR